MDKTSPNGSPERCAVCGAALEKITPVNTFEVRPPLVDVPEERKVPGITRTECPNGCPPERPVTLADIAQGEDPLKNAPFFFVDHKGEGLGNLNEEIKRVSTRLDANKSRTVKPPEHCSRCNGVIEMKNGCGFCPACVADGYVVGVFSFRMPGGK